MQEYELQVVAAQDRIANQNIISAQQSSEISHFGPQRPWADGYYFKPSADSASCTSGLQPYVA